MSSPRSVPRCLRTMSQISQNSNVMDQSGARFDFYAEYYFRNDSQMPKNKAL